QEGDMPMSNSGEAQRRSGGGRKPTALGQKAARAESNSAAAAADQKAEQLADQACGDLADELIGLIPGLRVYARNLMRGGSEVDDLVQETLMKALSNLEGFRQGTNLRAWLFTIMRNSFLTRVVKSTREPVGDEDCVSAKVITLPQHDALIAGNQVMAAIDRDRKSVG